MAAIGRGGGGADSPGNGTKLLAMAITSRSISRAEPLSYERVKPRRPAAPAAVRM